METKDFQKLTGSVDFITLVPGMFTIFFPHDAHEPGVSSTSLAVAVKKIVFKIPVKQGCDDMNKIGITGTVGNTFQ